MSIVPVHVIQTSFLGGILAEQSGARSDVDVYRHAAADIVNGIITRSGGIASRPGTRIVVPDAVQARRIFPIGSGGGQDYLLGVRGSQIWVWNARTWQQEAYLIGGGMQPNTTEPNYIPWTDDDIDALVVVPYFDGAVLVHPKYQPGLLRRTAQGGWIAERFVIPLSADNPAHVLLHPVAIVPRAQTSATVVSVTTAETKWTLRLRLVGSDVSYSRSTSPNPIWDHPRNPWHVYRDYQLAHTSLPPIPLAIEWGGDENKPELLRRFYGVVVAVHSIAQTTTTNWSRYVELTVEFPKIINGNKPSNLNQGDIVPRIHEPLVGPFVAQARHDRPVYAWPSTGCVAANRLWFASGTSRVAPHYVVASSLRSFWDWYGAANPDDGIAFALAAEDTPTVEALASLGAELFVATDLGPFMVRSAEGPLSPTSVVVERVGSFRCGRVQPETIDQMVVVPDRSAGIVRAIEMSQGSEGSGAYKLDDISIPVAGTLPPIKRIAVLETGSIGVDQRLLVCHGVDGTVWTCALSGITKTAAWCRWAFKTFPIHDLCVVAAERLVFLVSFSPGLEQPERYIAALDPTAWFDLAIDVPSGASAVSFFRRLLVAVRRGDEYVGEYVVDDFGFLPPDAVARIESGDPEQPRQVGIPFDFGVELLPPAIDLPTGPARHRAMRIRSIDVEYTGHAAPTVWAMPLDVPPDLPRGMPTDDPEPASRRRWARSRTLLRTWRQNGDRPILGRTVPAPIVIQSVAMRLSVLER